MSRLEMNLILLMETAVITEGAQLPVELWSMELQG
jgi:hypothetical protein